ncbi:hypothetical protein CYLTODRAFT_489349 [Cylindrobasidium torrendii FP15055 ss-10]|uniref:C2H2-type domain-containing protein n=1 Tax=Cylindrobasidium torrendii FP15055 ss-10 TaxID=1314674 RepID=A0A0D7BFE6_9AGAR|nr:hypothetical protein CYLTODRAFT_489349 [Cylindrobasidium torrendii FP15055 ss-10]
MTPEIDYTMPEILRCNECTFNTTSLTRFASHQQAHTGLEQYFRCAMPGCDFTTKTESRLRQHNLASCRIIDIPRVLYRCKPCDYFAESQEDLDAHKRVHTPYLCSWDSCGHVAHRKLKLRKHEARHSKETPYICSQRSCVFKSASKQALQVHRSAYNHFPSATNPNLASYSCFREDCKFTTLYKANIERHELVRHGVKTPPTTLRPSGRAVSVAVRRLPQEDRLLYRTFAELAAQRNGTQSSRRSPTPNSLEGREPPDTVAERTRKRRKFAELFGSSSDEEDQSDNGVSEEDSEDDESDGVELQERPLRYTEEDMKRTTRPLQDEIAWLRAMLAARGSA